MCCSSYRDREDLSLQLALTGRVAEGDRAMLLVNRLFCWKLKAHTLPGVAVTELTSKQRMVNIMGGEERVVCLKNNLL